MGCKPSKNGLESSVNSPNPIARLDSPTATQHMELDGIKFKYSWLTQRGYYPEDPKKENQDSFNVIPEFGTSDHAFFAVYDGHGKDGHSCARFVRDTVS